MDYGLIGGIAKGLDSGLKAYQDAVARREKREADKQARDFQREQFNAELQMKGYQKDPETGKYTRTDESLRKEREEGITGLIKQAGDDAPFLPAYGKRAQGLITGANPEYQPSDFQYPESYIDLKRRSQGVEKLAPEVQTELNDMARQRSSTGFVIDNIGAALKQLENPKLSDDQKVVIGQNMLKALNSPLGRDAVGKDEADRIASYLNYHVFNLTKPGPAFGRSIPDFITQIKNKSKELSDTRGLVTGRMQELRGGAKRGAVTNKKKRLDTSNPKVQEALDAGYTEDEIQEFLDAQ